MDPVRLTPDRRGFRRPRHRQLAVLALVVAIAIAFAWHWSVQSYGVVSGSMAGTLVGIHRQVTCHDCGYPFPVGSGVDDELPAVHPRAICPLCDATNSIENLPNHAGDRLLVVDAGLSCREPRRWDVTAFRDPRQTDRVLVKRIVGLPGEMVQIRAGDLYINGALARKDFAQQHSIIQLVDDSSYTPRDLPLRWQATASSTGWRSDAGYWRCRAASSPDFDWLDYRHLRRHGNSVAVRPIEDRYGYNQGRTIDDWNRINDLLLSATLRCTGAGEFALRTHAGNRRFDVVFDLNAKRATLVEDQRIVHTAPLPNRAIANRTNTIEISSIDSQLLVAIDGSQIFPPLLLDAVLEFQSDDDPLFSIGTRNLAIDDLHLRLFRDVYYTAPRTPSVAWGLADAYQLGPTEYFALGDNSPVSDDSRLWPTGPGVAASLVIGKPLLMTRSSLSHSGPLSNLRALLGLLPTR